MSVAVMGMVWQSGLPKNKKMTLLAYADHANDDGTSVYPGEAVMAEKTSDSPGNVRRVTKLLLEDGVLVQTKKGYRGQRAEFRIDLTRLAAHIARHSNEAKGAHTGEERRAESAERRASVSEKARGGATPNHQEPSEPSGNHHSEADKSATSELATINNTTSIEERRTYQSAMKNALIEAMGWDVKDVTKPQWGRIEAAAKQLRDIDADPAEVVHRAKVYRVNFNGATMTPNAIATNWADLAEVRVQVSKRDIERASNRAAVLAALEGLE